MKRQFFNLIEIVLAIGAIAIGMVSIMALFPVGANASRDAIAESYVSESADQLLHHFAGKAHENWSSMLGTVPEEGDLGADKGDFTPTWAEGVLIYPKSGQAGVYKVIQYRDSDADGTFDPTEPVDFEAIAEVYRTQSDIFDLDNDGFFNDDVNGDSVVDGNDTARAFSVAARLNVRISWPAQLPPAQRESTFYCLEVFNR